MDARTQHFFTAPPALLLLKMSTPNSIAFLVQSFVSMMEVWFIGRLGTGALAAIALSFPLLMLTQMMAAGALGGAVASAIARALGAGDVPRAERLVWHGLLFLVMGALSFLLIFLVVGKPFLAFLGGRGAVLEDAMNYCLVLFVGGVFLWSMMVLSAVYRGMGNMHYPAMLMVLGGVFQVVLTGCLVTGAFGLPNLGMVGAALSAVINGFLISLLLVVGLIKGSQTVMLRKRAMVFSRELFRDISRVAWPASLSPLLTIFTVLSITTLVGRFGEAALAGYGIGSRIEMLIVPLVFGLGASMTSLVGISLGAGDVHRAERVGWIGGAMAAGVSGVVGIVLALFPGFWIPIFTDDATTFESAKTYIKIAGPCFALQGLGLSLYFASQGTGKMVWPMVAFILRALVAVGGALLLGFVFDFGLAGIYVAVGLGMMLYGVLLAGMLKAGTWRP